MSALGLPVTDQCWLVTFSVMSSLEKWYPQLYYGGSGLLWFELMPIHATITTYFSRALPQPVTVMAISGAMQWLRWVYNLGNLNTPLQFRKINHCWVVLCACMFCFINSYLLMFPLEENSRSGVPGASSSACEDAGF